MLKKHSQLWFLFISCLLLILPAMIWVSVKAINTDRDLRRDRRETELARQEAEVQEKITSALYRMDWKLGPLIAREAARPYYLYESFYSQGTAVLPGLDSAVASPLLSQPSEFVKLHFQIQPDNQFSSPQRPKTIEACQKAFACCGVTQLNIDQRDTQLAQAQVLCNYDSILSKARSVEELSGSDFGLAAGNVYVQPQAFNFAKRFNDLQDNGANNEANAPNQPLQAMRRISKVDEQKRRSGGRGGKEFVKRQETYGNNAAQWALENRQQLQQQLMLQNEEAADIPTAGIEVVEGVMRPIWIDDNLLLARIVTIDKREVIQCCWLAWEKIKKALADEVADILPGVQFEPVVNDEMLVPDRALVTLPVQVVVDSQKLMAISVIGSGDLRSNLSGMHVALLVAWTCLLLSAIAIGALLHGVLQLSERRASFVSAVTHELRTPLTTFKMYSEMLAEKMVPDEKQVQYAETLKLQAERLSHLVENVLQFARLERGADKRTIEPMPMATLLSGIEARLHERATQSQRILEFKMDESILKKQAKVEPHAIEQILFNLVDNACKYAKSSDIPKIEVKGRLSSKNSIELSVRDFGDGVCGKNSAKVFQPFSKSDLEAANSEPGVGLGLALCRRMANSFNGRIYYENCKDENSGAKFFLQIPVWK